jgi:beta-N-acetylhexosaminidase
MTEAQRVGQLLMVKLPSPAVTAAVRDAIRTFHIGNWWYGRTTIGVEAMRAVSDDLQALATGESTGGAGFLISANQEGGLVQGLSGPGFGTIPSAVVQGTWSVDDLAAKASTWGGQLAEAGVNTNYAPVADVVPAGTESRNAPIGQLRREFGNDPDTVSDHVSGFIAGMQDAGILTTVKHFPGLGRV